MMQETSLLLKKNYDIKSPNVIRMMNIEFLRLYKTVPRNDLPEFCDLETENDNDAKNLG